MKKNDMTRISLVLLGLLIGISSAFGARKRAVPPPAPLTAIGQKLEAGYAARLTTLQNQIQAALPKVNPAQKAAFVKAYQDESIAWAAELKALRAQDRKKAGDPSKAAYEKAKKDLARATPAAEPIAAEMLTRLDGFLQGDKLDPKLVECAVISQATPPGLAAFAQQGKTEKSLITELLGDTALMKQMVIGGGAAGGKYGRAMEIYTAIQKASDKAKSGGLQRLALGVSLEHALPVHQTNAADDTSAPDVVDPVKRYLHFEKAYLNGELDPGFKDLSVWDYRFVVNGDEPDTILAWGRQMLHNYRSDEITTPDYRWRYVKATKTEVKYGSQDNKYDQPDLQKYQNIIKNGGVCGRRAFFGRFILRAFGIPTVARPQHGHATLVHWTPDGWVINLGAGWSWGWTIFGQDRDFLAYTQVRMTGKPFEQVVRAKLAGTACGEEETFGFHSDPSGFWNGVALYKQRQIIKQAEAKTLAAVGQDIGEANESKEKDVVQKVVLTDQDKTVTLGKDGTITIPAVACRFSAEKGGKILFMASDLGGKQMHYSRLGKRVDFDYNFVAPKAGKYALTARVVTTSWKQHLMLTVNDATRVIDIAAPFTVGMWGTTEPVQVTLAKGQNVLHFSRPDSVKGVTIKDFTLTPVAN